jgi:hypothetical protein
MASQDEGYGGQAAAGWATGSPSLRPGSLGRPGPREQVCSRRRLGVQCGQWVAGRTRLPQEQPSTPLHCVQGRSAGLGHGSRSVGGGSWECSAGSGSPGGPGSHRNSPTPRSRLRQSCFAIASQDEGYGGQAAAGWATGSSPLACMGLPPGTSLAGVYGVPPRVRPSQLSTFTFHLSPLRRPAGGGEEPPTRRPSGVIG